MKRAFRRGWLAVATLRRVVDWGGLLHPAGLVPAWVNGRWAATVLSVLAAAPAVADSITPEFEALLQRARQFEQTKTNAAWRPLAEADVRCGPWHCDRAVEGCRVRGVRARVRDGFRAGKGRDRARRSAGGLGQDLSVRAGRRACRMARGGGQRAGLGGRLLQPASFRAAAGAQRGDVPVPDHHLCRARGGDGLPGDAGCGQGMAGWPADSRRADPRRSGPAVSAGVVQDAAACGREPAAGEDCQVFPEERLFLRHRRDCIRSTRCSRASR